jgi:hypothetical protein
MKYKKVISTNFYDNSNFRNLLDRLENVHFDSERKWGSMTAAQMLRHLNLAIGSGLGYHNLPDNSHFISRTINQFLVLDVLKRFPIGTQTSKPLKVVDDGINFEAEKQQLKEILTKAYHTKTNADWGQHAYFGKMTRKAWGKLIMIHCNHHFQQFNSW